MAMSASFIDRGRSWIASPLQQLYSPVAQNDAAETIELENIDELENQVSTRDRGCSLLQFCRLSWMWCLVPFLITLPLSKTRRTLPKVTSTSYINGLRGICCVIVFNQHFLTEFFDWLPRSYGFTTKDNHFFQLPFLRLIHAGLFMVAIFFVLSGFALSYSPLRKCNSGDVDSSFFIGLSSSLFRRPIRLFVPMAAAIPIPFGLIYIYPFYRYGVYVSSAPNFLEHMGMYLDNWKEILNPFTWYSFWPSGFEHGWTLPMEYRGSIIIFLLCLLTCKMTPILRKVTMASTAFYSMYWGRWEVFCFIEGMFIAELRFAPLSADFPRVSALLTNISGIEHKTGSLLSIAAWSTVLLVGLFFGGWSTEGSSTTAPYKWLWQLMPERWQNEEGLPSVAQMYWLSIGAGLVLLSLEKLPTGQRLLRCTPLIYLGEISFSFYLLHMATIHSVGIFVSEYLVLNARWSHKVSYCFSYITSMVVLICVADLFWRAIDENVVKGSRRLAQWFGIIDTEARG